MTIYFVDRRTELVADSMFSLDIPDEVVAGGKPAIRAYIKEYHDPRDECEIVEDQIVFEEDEFPLSEPDLSC